MGVRIDQMSARLVFQNAKSYAQAASVSVQDSALTQSTLRTEVQLVTNSNHFTFGILTTDGGSNNGGVFNTEIRLRQQDSFISSMVALYIAEPSGVADATYVDYTNPNPAVFVGVGESVALQTLYKGYLKATVNGVVKVPTLHLGRFWSVPFAQKVAAAANQNGINYDSRDGSTDGTMCMEPNLVLIGSKGNLVEIFLPATIGVVGANTRAILEFRGLNAQNSTIIT